MSSAGWGGVEGAGADEEPVEGAGQGVLVGCGVEGGARHLFRGGVGEGGGEHARLGQVGGVLAQAGDAEVGEEHAFTVTGHGPGQNDVGGLHVSVQHAHTVRVIQCAGDAFDHLDRALGRQRGHIDAGGVDPVHVLHRDPQHVVLGAAVVHLDDIGVVQPRDQIRLTLEAGADLPVRVQFPIQQLERRQFAQAGMPGQIHRAHPALAEQSFDGEPGEHVPAVQHCLSTPFR